MKLFLEIPDGTWEEINKLVDAKPGNTIPARDFIIRACNRAVSEHRRLRLQEEHELFMRGHPWLKTAIGEENKNAPE